MTAVSVVVHIEDISGNPSVLSVLRQFADEPFLLLLDSASAPREQDCRYTVLTADPLDTICIDRVEYGSEPFEQLREWQRLLLEIEVGNELPPFSGGIAGLMSYDLRHAFEVLPTTSPDEFHTPVLLAGLFDWAIVWDHLELSVRLYVLQLPGQTIAGRVGWVRNRLARGNGAASGSHPPVAQIPIQCDSTRTETEYVSSVQRVIDYIAAGDIFQANLSQRLSADWDGSAIDLYERVRECNAAPFCGLLQTADFSVVSASPERFLKVSGRHVETRPIKGTRRRQQSPIADLYTAAELSASAKDRAENVMIVDLLRNDISRVCRTGSVQVTGICEVEIFQTVQHLVSTVVGELRDDCDVWDLCAVCFPGGSITGAPKIRAMEIISELEQISRGAYCGSLFCCGPTGDFDSSILIRTFTLKEGRVSFPVGGGIVADSLPRDEYDETLHKASGMLRCLRPGRH